MLTGLNWTHAWVRVHRAWVWVWVHGAWVRVQTRSNTGQTLVVKSENSNNHYSLPYLSLLVWCSLSPILAPMMIKPLSSDFKRWLTTVKATSLQNTRYSTRKIYQLVTSTYTRTGFMLSEICHFGHSPMTSIIVYHCVLPLRLDTIWCKWWSNRLYQRSPMACKYCTILYCCHDLIPLGV